MKSEGGASLSKNKNRILNSRFPYGKILEKDKEGTKKFTQLLKVASDRCAHSQSMFFSYRCVQCLDNHGPGNCPRKANKNLPIGCINCKNAGHTGPAHTANDVRNCKFIAELGKSSSLPVKGPAVRDTKSSPTVKSPTIIEPVLANNPHVKNQKKKKQTNNRVTTNNGLADLIGKLLTVLGEFRTVHNV